MNREFTILERYHRSVMDRHREYGDESQESSGGRNMNFFLKPLKHMVFCIVFVSILSVVFFLYWMHDTGCLICDSTALSHRETDDQFGFCSPNGLVQPDDDFHPQVVLSHAMRAITDFPIVPVDEAERKLDPAELVLGVTVGGESRAYPINALTGPHREIINDQLGGQAIAATW